ncbi:hypothetical protein EJB05_18665, partial [Eragrostis curvula]
MAISGRAAACTALIVPTTAAATPLPSTVSVNPRARQRSKASTTTMATVAAPHASTGGAVLDAPAFDQSQLDTPLPAQEGMLMLPIFVLPPVRALLAAAKHSRRCVLDLDVHTGGDPGRLKDRKGSGSGDGYKVLLVDHARHTEQHGFTHLNWVALAHFSRSAVPCARAVEKTLPQVVPSITAEAARQLFHESRLKGVAVVIVAVKEHAEFYAHMMVRQGLRSAIEPDSDLAS